MAGDLVISTINGVAIGTKNVIIDGNFNVNQRGVSGTVTLAAGAYGHDRWKGGASGATYTFATVANVTTLTISAGSLIQVVEGLNLQSGTYTLSFSGTAQGKINGGSFSASGVTGTATGGTNLNVEFNTGTLSLVQLEKGSTATSFDYRPYGTELQLCQRYYESSAFPATTFGLSEMVTGIVTASTTIGTGRSFAVTKRASPTVVLYSRNNTANAVSLTATGADVVGSSTASSPAATGFYAIALGTAPASAAGIESGYTASAEL
jgi:hypothetical protein